MNNVSPSSVRISFDRPRSWEGNPLGHPATNVTLSADDTRPGVLKIRVASFWFNDPKPVPTEGRTDLNMKDYDEASRFFMIAETIELFFSNADHQYLQVAVNP
ncbi:unnamed protein product [Darwinula stevensoni]|uniref:Uncharacterized protein n=1 Tax=Darwinula stevensoni TaxID=69355 RepID=A0A7R8X865_9CRUS|nr:unnamed protein product [Darwinula stevensoni]CAG0884099.1 unnamed protein product [Darwinula stevensoni]